MYDFEKYMNGAGKNTFWLVNCFSTLTIHFYTTIKWMLIPKDHSWNHHVYKK